MRRHWRHVARRKGHAGRNYVEDGALNTSGDAMAGIDLARELIEEDHGRELARMQQRQSRQCSTGFLDCGF